MLHSRIVAVASDGKHIIIAGIGLVSPLGNSAWATFRALLSGATIAQRTASMPPTTNAVDLVRAVGGVSIAQHAAADPTVDLAERAAREALHEAATEAAEMDCVIGASKGAVHALTGALGFSRFGRPRRLPRGSVGPAPPVDAELAVVLGPQGYLSHHLKKRLGCNGMRSVVASCASSLAALHQARLALLRGPRSTRRTIVVTAEAALLPAFIHSYRRLGVLAPLSPRQYCGRPLDQARNGFMLCEVGAAIVLERTACPCPGQLELVDTAVATEAHDLIRPAPDMPALTTVASQVMARRPVDLIHAHTTGTVEQDPAELLAYQRAMGLTHHFSARPVDVYAVKGALGHGLGASGLVSLVIACLSARTNRRPPMPWLTNAIELPKGNLRISGSPDLGVDSTLATQAVFAAGFGGHVAAALIRRV